MTFRIVGEHLEWTGRRVRAAILDIAGPDGGVHQREVIRHPGAVATVPRHEDGTITLVRQYRAAVDAELWEIPAGLRDVPGEPPEATAQRELGEEVGLRAAHLEHLITFHNSPGFSDESVVIYLATGLESVPHDRQGAEEQAMAVERRSLAEARAMVADGRITDAKTVIAVLTLVAR